MNIKTRVKAGSNASTVALRVVEDDEKESFGPENDCAGEDQQQLQTTDPSSCYRERSTSTNPQLCDSNKNLVVSPRLVLYSKPDWPTDRRS
jgi:hypothetical protein